MNALFTPSNILAPAVLIAVALTGCGSLNEPLPPRRSSPPTAAETIPLESGAEASGSALDSQLAGLNRQIEARREYNARLRPTVAAKEKLLAKVLASDQATRPNVQEFELRTKLPAEIAKIDRVAPGWQETIDAHRAVLKGASSDPRGPELEAEIARLAAEKTELLRLRERLVAISEKLGK